MINILTTQNKSEPIHGLLIEVWIRGSLDDDCIGKVYTNRNGIASLKFEPDDSVISEAPVIEIYLRIRDRDGSLIYSTKEEPRALRPGKPLGYDVVLDKEVLAGHFSRPLSWEAPSGSLVPEERQRHIKAAISLIALPDEPDHEALMKASLDIHPPIDFFDNILQDAWLVLQGDPDALLRFRDALGVIYANNASNARNSFESAVNIDKKIIYEEVFSRDNIFVKQLNNSHFPRDLVPIDNIRILLMAAFHAGGGNKALSTLYLKIVLDQLSKYRLLETLHRASVSALTGGDIEKNHFRSMLFCMSGLGFGNYGFMPPADLGAPIDLEGSVDWNGLGDWNAGRWDTIPNPEGEIGSIIRELEKGGLPTLGPCEMEMLVKLLPIEVYIITEVIPSRACPGEDITIKGNGFGNLSGKVCFRKYGSSDFDVFPIEVAPISWSETEIKVKVPNGAGCFLRLLLQPKTAEVCGKFIDIKKVGLFKAQFEGSSPEIYYFFESNNYNGYIWPGDPLYIYWGTKAADHVYIEILDTNKNSIGKLDPAGNEGEWKFTKTDFSSLTRLQINIVAKGKCNPSEVAKPIFITVYKRSTLIIEGIEVTQAIQYYSSNMHLTDKKDQGPDNSLQLVADKPAWVRVFILSGQDPNYDGGLVHNINGTLTVERSINGWFSKIIDIDTLSAPYTAYDFFPSYVGRRGNINSTLNFIIPANIMNGLLRLTVSALSADDYSGIPSTRTITVDVNLQQRLQVAAFRIGYNGPNTQPGIGNVQSNAPNLNNGNNNCAGECQFALNAFPVSSNLNIRDLGSDIATQPINNLRDPGKCDKNWFPILDMVTKARINDGNKAGWIYFGFVTPSLPVAEISGGKNCGCSRGIDGAAIIENGVGFAHESGHQLGLGHSPCGPVADVNTAYPLYEPYDSGMTTTITRTDSHGNNISTTNWNDASIGEFGLNVNNGQIFAPIFYKDFMSYCGDPWISIYSHKFLTKNQALNPITLATGLSNGSNGSEGIMNSEIRPLIILTGYIDKNGKVNVANVARMQIRYPIADGEETEYVVELIDEQGCLVSSNILYALPQHSIGNNLKKGRCDNREMPTKPPHHFMAALDNITLGASLRIRKGTDIIWQRERPKRDPKVHEVNARLGEHSRLIISWEYEVFPEEKPEVWLRWSNDKGKNWNSLAVGIKEDHTEIDIDNLPAGEVIFQVLSHDGFNTVSKESQSIIVPERAPSVSILYPGEGLAIEANMPLRLLGSVVIRSLNTLKAENYIWCIDGKEVGRGIDIFVNNPGIGRHKVEFLVNDPAGKSIANVSITVKE